MYNFFIDKSAVNGDICTISGNDFNHIKNVLRMKIGENLLVSFDGKNNLCSIVDFLDDACIVKINQADYFDSSLKISLYLFQGLPKSDKMELIIQKAVELGADAIIPVEMNRSVVKLDDKKKKSKVERFNNISESAAKQSKRTTIPKVYDVLTFNQALELAKTLDMFIIPYENERGVEATKKALSEIKAGMKIGVMIGSEGGFDESEIEKAINIGGKTISLGSRILRTETAAITTLSLLMLHSEMYL